PNLVFDAVVRQTSYKSFAVSGTYASNPRTLFLGKFDSLKTRIWGGESQGRFARIQASTSEGRIIVLDGRAIVNDSLFFTIFNPDSSIIWRLGLPRSGLTPNNPEINDIVFDGNGGVILCGSKKRINSNRDELFFMKISGVGLPYDPFADTVLVKSSPKNSPKVLKIYPNPTADQVWFSGVKGHFHLTVYAADGRKVMEQEMDEGMPVSLIHLPLGLYTYRIRQADKWWTGKLMKE
ncbi:MAG TPA: T9SS type A sorting domain-containing protein, partial [Catalimonadaceae bacterium]|nr:T9SS type A sorting domain-containing protein [Catalimonadaceae bacterium]